jgi:uncharacterized protein YbaR (Trm112 family)
MATRKCPLCKQEVSENLLELHSRKEKMIIELIKKKNPGWVEKDGACPKCLEYYRAIESN